MSSMFLKYQNIASNYTPNNLMCSFPVGKSYTKLDPVHASKPYEEYNSKGELIGYFWHQGETLNLEFNIDGEIVVESDAIIYNAVGDFPTVSTVGKLGQKAYNIVDLRSWRCIQVIDGNYIWEEDPEFIHDEATANKSIYVTASEFLKEKQIEVTLYNFRMEPIYQKTYEGTPKVIFPIDAELSRRLVKGIYYCSLIVFDDNIRLPIFSSHDCTLLVK